MVILKAMQRKMHITSSLFTSNLTFSAAMLIACYEIGITCKNLAEISTDVFPEVEKPGPSFRHTNSIQNTTG
jgi:hypothetical protein